MHVFNVQLLAAVPDNPAAGSIAVAVAEGVLAWEDEVAIAGKLLVF